MSPPEEAYLQEALPSCPFLVLLARTCALLQNNWFVLKHGVQFLNALLAVFKHRQNQPPNTHSVYTHTQTHTYTHTQFVKPFTDLSETTLPPPAAANCQ